eukprot:m51a1_g5977 hypothetical protein (144) ;mRNA; f:242924-243355
MSILFGTSLLDELNAMHKQLDTIANNRNATADGQCCEWVPACDLTETATGFSIAMDLPGVRKEDVSIDLHEGVLIVAGTRAAAARAEGTQALRTERPWGKFSRSFTMPRGVEPAGITASFDNGVLVVGIAKPKESIPYKVQIN